MTAPSARTPLDTKWCGATRPGIPTDTAHRGCLEIKSPRLSADAGHDATTFRRPAGARPGWGRRRSPLSWEFPEESRWSRMPEEQVGSGGGDRGGPGVAVLPPPKLSLVDRTGARARHNCAVTPEEITCHCGRAIVRQQQFRLESDLQDCCYGCAVARCDGSTSRCPFATDQGPGELTAVADPGTPSSTGTVARQVPKRKPSRGRRSRPVAGATEPSGR